MLLPPPPSLFAQVMKGRASDCTEEHSSANLTRRKAMSHSCMATSPLWSDSSEPIDIVEVAKEVPASTRVLQKKPWQSDIDREEAWQKKRDLFLVGGLRGFAEEEEEEEEEEMQRSVGCSACDCSGKAWQKRSSRKGRTRSLTDEDLEELKGCIDLGFGFSHHGSFDLRTTLPALDLYCAINRQYNDMKSRSSPASPLDGTPLQHSSSTDSYGSSLSDSWKISSPGDNPGQVKTRLRHWAQAVACSIRQGSF